MAFALAEGSAKFLPVSSMKAVSSSRSALVSSSTVANRSMSAMVVALELAMSLSCVMPEHFRNR